MLGLTALEHDVHPLTTFDKLIFLLEYAWEDTHPLTAVVSFGALGVLGVLRATKAWVGRLAQGEGAARKKWVVGVRAIPEVLVVVLGATGKPFVCLSD